MPEEKRPKAQPLVDMCRYYRLVDRDLLQIVDGSFARLIDALDSKGAFSKYVGTGGFIGINVLSLYEQFTPRFAPFGYGECILQQRLIHFQFPGMRKDWCNSFLNLFCDDFPYAMELGKELFLEETLPWLNQMTTPEKHAQWRLETLSEYFIKSQWAAKNALWSQLKLRRWQEAETCIQKYFKCIRDRRIKEEYLPPYMKEIAALMERIRQAIAREDTAFIDQILEENKKRIWLYWRPSRKGSIGNKSYVHKAQASSPGVKNSTALYSDHCGTVVYTRTRAHKGGSMYRKF